MPEALREELMQSILSGDICQSRSVIEQWIELFGQGDAVTGLVEPVLGRLGNLWEEGGQFNLAQGYLAAKIAEEVLLRSVDSIPPPNVTRKKGPIVLGNVEDDFHSLGRKMVAAFLQVDGWEVYDLGNDVPAEDFVTKAVEVGAKVIGVSAMTYTNARNIRRIRTEIETQGCTGKMKLAVGGAVFALRPELVAEGR